MIHVNRRAAALLVMGSFWSLAAACSEEPAERAGEPAPESGVFGGAGGAFSSGGKAGAGGGTTAPAGAGGGGTSARCANVAGGTAQPLIDDFEDGDVAIRAATDREGFWFVYDDGTGGTFEPAGGFATTLGGPGNSSRAVRIQASGFTDFGVAVGTNLNQFSEGLRCPINAEDYQGISFDARGPGAFNVMLNMPGVVSTEFGGDCDPDREVCWDGHAVRVVLSEDFRHYELTWDQFEQGGWGKIVEFDSGTVLGLSFTVSVADLPIDFWVDNVSFMVEPTGDPQPWGGAGGQGGASGGTGGDAGAGGSEGGAGGTVQGGAGGA